MWESVGADVGSELVCGSGCVGWWISCGTVSGAVGWGGLSAVSGAVGWGGLSVVVEETM